MSLIDKISEFFLLSTPLVDSKIEKLLADKDFREKLLKAIEEERKNYKSENENNESDGIKRVGEFSY
jgi:hypothetical protein